MHNAPTTSHDDNDLLTRSNVFAYRNSRRGYMPKSRSSAIINYSAQKVTLYFF